MATATPTSGATAAKTPAVEVSAVSRREFLYYIWGASIALLLGEVGAAIVWYALPRFREGEFGGIIPVQVAELPGVGETPISIPTGRFHVSHTKDNGLVALYGVCTHLGCLPKWEPVNERFACPCHGSQYELDGRWITGPAPRGLDRFPLEITLADGRVLSNRGDGWPINLSEIPLDQIVSAAVDTGSKVTGPAHGSDAKFSAATS